MKKIILPFLFFIFFAGNSYAQNVGIGTTTPAAKLHVSSTDTNMVRIENTTTLASGVSNAIYFKTGSWFTGAIKHTGTGTDVSRTGFFGYASTSTTGLKEYLSITDAGNVGIGTTTPTSKLDIAGSLKISDGTQGNNKVLTSDANGNASWQEAAFGNTERFSFINEVFSGSPNFVINYNTGTITASDASANVTSTRKTTLHITRTGLYHFSINVHCVLTATTSTVGMLTLDLSDGIGRKYVYANDSPLFSGSVNIIRSFYDKEIDLYIDQPMDLFFSSGVYNGGASFTLNLYILSITGHLIAD